jgi:hypothetical protein
MKPLAVKQILIPLALLAVMALSACSAMLSVIQAQEASKPSIKILVPGDNPRVGLSGDGWCPVVVEVNNFKLVDKGEANIAGEGHIHYYLDTEPDAANSYADTIETTYYWPQVGKGQHTFLAELVNNDHTPLNPPVIARAGTSAGNYWDS